MALCESPRRPPLKYYGGKFRIAPWIIDHLPKHSTYVEVFGGAAGVLLRKPRSRVEIYNDLDSSVVNFFLTLRARPDELCRLVDLTPYSREEFELAYVTTDDALEAARRFITRCFFGFGPSIDPADSNGFRRSRTRRGQPNTYATEWAGIPEALAATAIRLKEVVIESKHFRRLIPLFNDAATVLYVDPPYPMSARRANGKGYLHEMSDADHRDLAWLLKSTESRVLVSGYACPLYEELYSDWRRDEKSTMANGQTGASPRTEVLWMNF
jgi:DNA adenine methylase